MMIEPTVAHPLHTADPLKAHSTLGAMGWGFATETLESLAGRPPNAVRHYRRGSKRAILCRSHGEFLLAEYVDSQAD